MIQLMFSISSMVSGCLGTLDSNGMDDVVDHEYETLPPSTQEDPAYFWSNQEDLPPSAQEDRFSTGGQI